MDSRTNKKYRFLALLPYGLCSRQALYLCTKIPEISLVPYSPDLDMRAREKLLQQASTAITRTVERMMQTGYIEEKVRKYGTTLEDQLRMITLTKAGFFLLTSTPDIDVEMDRQNTMGDISYTKMLGLTYRSTAEADELLCIVHNLRQADNEFTDNEIAAIDEAFYNALDSGEMTILACDSLLAKEVDTTNTRYNAKRIYRCWRLANINALFMANEFLTYLDRRPIETNWAIGNIRDTASYERYLSNGELDIPAYMFHALNKWYSEHPTSLRFLEPLPESDDPSVLAKLNEEWRTTPAFYAMSEIPGFYSFEEDSETQLTKGFKNNLYHTFAGIAIGKKLAYIVHHTRPTKTPWGERTEMTTIEVLQNSLEEAGIFSPTGEPYRIKEALIICGSIYQFESFYNKAKNRISKAGERVTKNRIGVPYNSICLIPVNGSGAMQLRYLMLYSPMEMDYIMVRSLQKLNPKFERTADPLFPLTYEGTLVFVAHSMQLQQLYEAQMHYIHGTKFYVCCYPGQVKYIRRLMPTVQFL